MKNITKFYLISFLVIGVALAVLTACSALGIQTKVEDARQKALEQLVKAACADPKETEAFVRGSKLEAIDFKAICQ